MLVPKLREVVLNTRLPRCGPPREFRCGLIVCAALPRGAGALRARASKATSLTLLVSDVANDKGSCPVAVVSLTKALSMYDSRLGACRFMPLAGWRVPVSVSARR